MRVGYATAEGARHARFPPSAPDYQPNFHSCARAFSAVAPDRPTSRFHTVLGSATHVPPQCARAQPTRTEPPDPRTRRGNRDHFIRRRERRESSSTGVARRRAAPWRARRMSLLRCPGPPRLAAFVEGARLPGIEEPRGDSTTCIVHRMGGGNTTREQDRPPRNRECRRRPHRNARIARAPVPPIPAHLAARRDSKRRSGQAQNSGGPPTPEGGRAPKPSQ